MPQMNHPTFEVGDLVTVMLKGDTAPNTSYEGKIAGYDAAGIRLEAVLDWAMDVEFFFPWQSIDAAIILSHRNIESEEAHGQYDDILAHWQQHKPLHQSTDEPK